MAAATGAARGQGGGASLEEASLRATRRAVLWAALLVYGVYFVLSIRQSSDALSFLGQGVAFVPLRRALMPAWLYLRGALMVLVTGSRPTFLLGHVYPHGVWFYFPIVFLLKSPLGFLGLLLLLPVLALLRRRAVGSAVPSDRRGHWRVLCVSLVVFTAACLLSRLTISIRHFSVPVVLLTVLLAPLPRMLAQLRPLAPRRARAATVLTVALAVSSLVTTARAYPYLFPYVNALALGRPAFVLVSDSNVDWNQSLPEVRRFAERQGLGSVAVDTYGLNDPAVAIPQARVWDCQRPAPADAGRWVVVSANAFLDNHNCSWLLQYPREELAGGSMYAVRLGRPIPNAGSPQGPPSDAECRGFFGTPVDLRSMFGEYVPHPERLPRTAEEMQKLFPPPKR